jgi:hypothetical protein
VDLIATPDGMENDEQRSGSRVDGFDCEANATWCSTGGFAKSEAAARQQIHDFQQSGAKLLVLIKLACFFR